MKLKMVQFLFVLVSALHLYGRKNPFLCLTATIVIVKASKFRVSFNKDIEFVYHEIL